MSLKVNGDLVEGIDVLRQIAHFPLVHRTWMLRWRMRTSTTAAGSTDVEADAWTLLEEARTGNYN